ncbi:hypothetical protein [Streptomyces sp. SID13031]|uniref:hypothetical protein n=1 Tax=Streptomyces sp. SID13031 TaxID=2706046 RepID=UPI0013CB0ABD|nr:hypothetical protein [Streptomyces sp. SID13031]NEA37306.1 hypothetical protein [Streptomyces sp. SID13031]
MSAGGDHLLRTVISHVPRRATTSGEVAGGAFEPGQVKLSSSMVVRAWPVEGPGAEGSSLTGDLIIGDGLYWTHYVSAGTGAAGPDPIRIGGGGET